MNGATILKGVVFNSVPAQWSVVGQQINGDGFADILWRDTAGNVGMWLMNEHDRASRKLQLDPNPVVGGRHR